MKNIIIKCGSMPFPKSFPASATVSEIINNASVKAVLGYGDNVRALINGVEQDMGLIVPDGTTISVETRCNSKAV